MKCDKCYHTWCEDKRLKPNSRGIGFDRLRSSAKMRLWGYTFGEKEDPNLIAIINEILEKIEHLEKVTHELG